MATRWPEPSFEGLDTTSPVELANNFEDYYKDVFMYTLKNPTAAAPARYVMDIMFQANKIMALMKSEIAVPGSGYVAASVDPAPNPNPNPNPRPEELKREEVDVDAFPVSIPYARVHNAPPPPQVPDPAARFEQMMANLDQSTRQYHVDGDRDNEHDGHDGVDDGAVEYFRPGDFMDNAMDSEQEDSDWDDESEETDSEFYEYSEGSDAEPEEETGIETGTGTETEYYEYTEGSAVNTEKECGAIKTECEAAEPEKLEELHEADDEKEPDEGEHRSPGAELAQCLRLGPRDSETSPDSNTEIRSDEHSKAQSTLGQDPVGQLSVASPEPEQRALQGSRDSNHD